MAELKHSNKMVTKTSNQQTGTSHCKQIPVCCTLAYTSPNTNQINKGNWQKLIIAGSQLDTSFRTASAPQELHEPLDPYAASLPTHPKRLHVARV